MAISIVMPNYNGDQVLRRCFPETHACFRRACPAGEIVVVDDASTDDGMSWLEESYSDLRLIRKEHNQGFGATANRGITEANGEWVLLLNTDIVLLDGWLEAAQPHLEDPTLFAVTFMSLDENRAFREGANRVGWRSGLPFTHHNPGDQRRDRRGRILSSYPVGGHCLVRRDRFLELGGFDLLFEPFYWEDADLGLRAGARGWATIYEPACQVLHLEHGSIRSNHSKERIRRTKLRNRFLLAWRLAGRRRWWLGHGLLALTRFLPELFRPEGSVRQAYRDACRRWREVVGSDA